GVAGVALRLAIGLEGDRLGNLALGPLGGLPLFPGDTFRLFGGFAGALLGLRRGAFGQALLARRDQRLAGGAALDRLGVVGGEPCLEALQHRLLRAGRRTQTLGEALFLESSHVAPWDAPAWPGSGGRQLRKT